MVLLSAYDDFVLRTLASVPGLLGKLAYIGRLRTDEGTYSHWGLAQVYGEPTAGRALAQAHTQAWMEVLRAPLPSLWEELQQTSRGKKGALEAVKQLSEQREKMIPANLGGGSVRHFSSILSALVALCRAPRDASRKAA